MNYKHTQWADYVDVAIKKAGIGAIAIDALHFLSEEQNWDSPYAIVQSYSKFSVAFQLFDDVLDYKSDFSKDFKWDKVQIYTS